MRKLFFFILISLLPSTMGFADAAKTKAGKEIFNGKGMCAGCHVLKDAGANGNIGPSLDQLKPSMGRVTAAVNGGLGIMPAFGATGMLTPKEIEAVSFYVATNAGK
jgi:cytochrome c6